LLGAIALLAAPLAHQSHAEEQDCPDYFDGMTLSDQQQSDIAEIETQFDETMDDILPVSPEDENQLIALEEAFDTQVEALFSEGQQQLEQIDQWAEEQALAIAPELFSDVEFEDEEDISLTPQQETALDDIEEEYDNRVGEILTADQVKQIETLEEQFKKRWKPYFLPLERPNLPALRPQKPRSKHK